MKQFHKFLFTFLILSGTCFSLVAQNGFFSDASESSVSKTGFKRMIVPQKYRTVTANTNQLKAFLWSLPSEKNIFNRAQAPVMELPMPDGSTARFHVWESSIQEPGLEAKFPTIKTFAGQGIDDPYATMRFDYTEFGFHAQIRSVTTGNIYLDPYARGDVNSYISYYNRDNKRITSFACETPSPEPGDMAARQAAATGPCRGTELYTYRLAIACTGEYAVAVGGTTPALLHSAIVTSVNRVDGVYEDEVTVRMVLIANNNIVEYLNAATDPFTGNNNAGTLINESQTVINANIGSANYDIGHTFSTGGGGVAQLGCVCSSGSKARGITGNPSPVGDSYDIDYVAHEMGHQFGGNHTFNSNIGSCQGNRNASTAYEVGSGTTIMAYAGICSTASSTSQDNTQDHSDAFFHTVSFDEISNFLQAGGHTCPVITATNNNIPVITSIGTTGLSIPVNTPFVLTGTATDADNDPLTYCWEEWDLGPITTWNGGNANTTSPLFKSQIPTTSGSRSFPSLAYIIAGFPANPIGVVGGLKGETLPTQARVMKFRLTVRDNRAGGGGIVTGGNGCGTFSTPFTVNVVGTTPFAVTVPNGGETWAGASSQTITWNVAATNTAPVNAANVKITLSTDGGLTYPTVILASTPNDGTESITVPATPSTTARVRIEAVNNIFFDISNANFTITSPPTDYTFSATTPATVACGGAASAAVTLATTAQGGFSTPVVLTATGNPAGTTVTFSVNPLTPGNSTVVTLNNTNTLAAGTYTITVTGVAGAITHTATLTYTVSAGTAPVITTQPAPLTVCAGANATFTVAATGTALSYQWQVNNGSGYSNITGATSASYTVTGTTATQNGYNYQVIVSALCGTTTSSAALLTVNTAAAITTQPSDAAVCTGSSNTFTVAATGSNLTYQWQESTTGCAGSFTSITGATSASYTLTNITVAQNNYAYQVIVTGACGAPAAITSTCATLTVSSSVSIATQPVAVTTCAGSTAVFTVAGSGSGITYQWQVSTNNGTTYTNITGETNPTLTLTATAALDGNLYQAVLSNASCATPTTSTAVLLTVQALPAITTQPQAASICEGSNATFTSAATGTNITFQWQLSTNGGTTFTDIAGATAATYTVNAATAALNNNQYHVVVSGTCTPAAISNNATLTVASAVNITGQPAAANICDGQNATFTVTNPGIGISYQWQVSTNSGSTYTTIAGATAASYTVTAATLAQNNNLYQVVVSSTCGTATSSAASLTVNQNLTITQQPADATLCIGSTNTFSVTVAGTGLTYQWQVSTDGGTTYTDIPGATSASYDLVGITLADNNNMYHVIITGGCAPLTSAPATLTVGTAASINVTLTATPATTVLPGQTVVLTAAIDPASASGLYELSWTINGELIPGFSGNTRNVTVDEVGAYQVTATDVASGSCSKTSNTVTIRDSITSRLFIWPVPNDGRFHVAYYNFGGINTTQKVTIYDSKGARVFSQSFPIARTYPVLDVDLRGVSTGVYVVELTDGSGRRLATEKILIH